MIYGEYECGIYVVLKLDDFEELIVIIVSVSELFN